MKPNASQKTAEGSLVAFEKASGSFEQRLKGAFAKVALAARHALRRRAAEEGLSAVQAQVLVLLEGEGPMEVGVLARRLALTAATVSDSVTALENNNLLRRSPTAKDHRRVNVIPTAKGRRLARSLALWPELFERSIGQLSEQEKLILYRVLTRTILTFLEEGIIQEARMCVTCTYFRPRVHDDPSRPHHCDLVHVPLGPMTLRIDCPDHVLGTRVAASDSERFYHRFETTTERG